MSNINGQSCKALSVNQNLSRSDPASQYLRLKLIQNTVRVPTSLYMSDLGALNVYQNQYKPQVPSQVNWNQMSDRVFRHTQPTQGILGGSMYHGSSTKRTQTANRPTAMNPGGSGVDIKHNSYYRYMNRLKGKGPVRRGPIPPFFGTRAPFNPAFPIYGGKTMKTSIVSGCSCPIISTNNTTAIEEAKKAEEKLYKVYAAPNVSPTDYVFQVNNYVYAKENKPSGYFTKAQITAITGNAPSVVYTLLFEDNTNGNAPYYYSDLLVYFPCNCNRGETSGIILSEYELDSSQIAADCYILNHSLESASVEALYISLDPFL